MHIWGKSIQMLQRTFSILSQKLDLFEFEGCYSDFNKHRGATFITMAFCLQNISNYCFKTRIWTLSLFPVYLYTPFGV